MTGAAAGSLNDLVSDSAEPRGADAGMRRRPYDHWLDPGHI